MKKNAIIISLISFLVLIILQFVLSFLFYKIFNIKSQQIIFAAIDLSFIIAVVGLTYFWKLKLFNDFSIPTIKLIVLTILISFLIVLIRPLFDFINFIISLTHGVISFNYPANFKFINVDFSYIYYLIRVLVIMPILEELYYRRILLNSISIKFNSFIAILISSLLFSIGHLDFENTFQFFIMGLILGYFYLKTKNIGLSILLHAFINFFGIFILYKDIPLEGFNRLYLVFYPVVIVLIIFLFKRCLKPLIPKNIIN